MFWGQVAATAVAGTVQLGVQAWMFSNIPDICSTTQKDGFICPSTEVFGTASFVVSILSQTFSMQAHFSYPVGCYRSGFTILEGPTLLVSNYLRVDKVYI